VDDLKTRLRSLEQYTRRNNIEVSGVPVTPGEDVIEIVKDLGAAIGVDVDVSQVAAAHRIPSYKQDRVPSMVVQFCDRTVRDSWISSFKKRRNITAKDVNASYPAQKFYINEHLSPENKMILSKLKKKYHDLGFKYVWGRGGKFYARKTDGEKRLNISSKECNDILK